MENKSVQQLTNEEILRRQLKLLAERSQQATIDELPELTHAMVEIFNNLPNNNELNLVDIDGVMKQFANRVEEIVSKLQE